MDILKDFLKDYLSKFNLQEVLALPPEEFDQDWFGMKGFRRKVLLREKPWQVEFLNMPPNTIVPEHIHPNIDSYEVYLDGKIEFSHSGKWAKNDFSKVCEFIDGWFCIRVKPDHWHGGVISPTGGTFMSVQHWLNDVDPTCVGMDYEGYNIDEVKDNELDWKCAAHLETEGPTWPDFNDFMPSKIRDPEVYWLG